eukprot:TRINITY_DN19019_c0_g1_i2.p1 TRINITY_DN19019_c0_g1~~TRINITY_DN19019_c0_g1_i2.p1  ORF type:complete len:479 (-),score=66.24 TRINITY_DN19019_c0_g1_i2:288-1568(-)
MPPYRFALPEYARRDGFPDAVTVDCSEKAIMLIKAALFDDKSSFEAIKNAADPATAKRLGRGVQNFDSSIWEAYLPETAFEIVRQKFESDDRLKHLLLKTGDKIIVEAAPGDRVWGVGIAKSDPRIYDPSQWNGRNILGKALMDARSHLRGNRITYPRPQQFLGKGAPVNGKGGHAGQANGKAAPVKGKGGHAGQASAKAAGKNGKEGYLAQPGISPGKREEEVLPFCSHEKGHGFTAFCNSYTNMDAYEFVMPAFARPEGFPDTVRVESCDKAVVLVQAALFMDKKLFDEVAAEQNPAKATALDRSVHGFKQDVWDEHLHDAAFEVVRQKFESDTRLRELLLSTENRTLALATPDDTVWGVGLDIKDVRIHDETQWRGKNVLGKALMKARSHLQKEDAGDWPKLPAASGPKPEAKKRSRWGRSSG